MITRAALLVTLMFDLAPLRSDAQTWAWNATLPALGEWSFGSGSASDHLVCDVENDVVVAAYSNALLGVLRVHARHANGLDQWGTIAEVDFNSVVALAPKAYGWALDLDAGRLAVTVRGGAYGTTETGSVFLYRLDVSDPTEPLQLIAQVTAPGLMPEDHFGHCVQLSGNELFVGAPGRPHALGSGAVFIYTIDGDQVQQRAVLQPPPGSFGLPFMGGFGSALAVQGDRLVVVSPSSGVAPGFECGAIHPFIRNENDPAGWSALSAWYQPALNVVMDPVDGTLQAVMRMNNLGEEGVFLDEDQTFVHWARPHGSTTLQPACEHCQVVQLELTDAGYTVVDTLALEADEVRKRGLRSWCSTAGRLFVNHFVDPVSPWIPGTWGTTELAPVQGGGWEAVSEIPALDDCQELFLPVRVSGNTLIRATKSPGCTWPTTSTRYYIEVFQRQEEVGVETPEDHYSTLGIYPQPATVEVQIDLPYPAQWAVEVFGVDGASCTPAIRRSTPHAVISVDALAPGPYVVRATDGTRGTTLVGRLLVQ